MMPTDTASARTAILANIRRSLGASTPASPEAIAAEWNAIPRLYERSATLSHAEIIEMLEDRLRDYDATVERIRSSDLSTTIARLISARAKRRILIPEGLAEILSGQFSQPLPEGFDFIPDTTLPSAEIDLLDGVLTTCQVAIASTGTIVLQAVPGQGRRAASLIPDYHLCIVHEDDIVQTVPEAFDRLADTAALATTFISGPSATADIEMTRIKGVHGPRFLDVVLVS